VHLALVRGEHDPLSFIVVLRWALQNVADACGYGVDAYCHEVFRDPRAVAKRMRERSETNVPIP
jgi:hypothetical protein